MGGSQGPLGHPTASLSHLEEMRIDWKLVPSEKVCRQPELVRVVKVAFGVWSREEVVHDDWLFQEVRQTLWRDRMRSQTLLDLTAPLRSRKREQSRGG